MKEPYKGLYNFVGGKVESGESSLAAAYRELKEESHPEVCFARLNRKVLLSSKHGMVGIKDRADDGEDLGAVREGDAGVFGWED